MTTSLTVKYLEHVDALAASRVIRRVVVGYVEYVARSGVPSRKSRGRKNGFRTERWSFHREYPESFFSEQRSITSDAYHAVRDRRHESHRRNRE